MVSIVTPTFNSAAFIREHLASVGTQTYPNIEHVLVDGASTDGTVDLIRDYAATRCVKWVSEPDDGATDAVNKGFQMAAGDIIVILPSDDMVFPWSVDVAAGYLHANPHVDIVTGDWLAWDVSRRKWHLRLQKPFGWGFMARTQCLAAQATYFRRQVLHEVGGIPERYPSVADYEFWLKATAGRPTRHVREVLAVFRKRQGANHMRPGSAEIVELETSQLRAEHFNTRSPAYQMLRWWDRAYDGIYRRLLVTRMLYASARFDANGPNTSSKAQWGHFLSAYDVSVDSWVAFCRTMLPGRKAYELTIRARQGACGESLPNMGLPRPGI